MTTNEYLYDTEETRRKRELHLGILREPPAPFWRHQQLVLRIARVLGDHVDAQRLGRVAVAPVDVILDADRALIVQPDVLFISEARTSIIRNQVYGAPDFVVEVLPGRNHPADRFKLRWYREYGVRECWLVDTLNSRVSVFTFGPDTETAYAGETTIRSTVFPGLDTSAHLLFLD